MSKKAETKKNKHGTLIVILVCAIALSAIVLGWALYNTRQPKVKMDPLPNHTIPYVDGEEATRDVENFYNHYIKAKVTPSLPTVAEYKKRAVESFGSEKSCVLLRILSTWF